VFEISDCILFLGHWLWRACIKGSMPFDKEVVDQKGGVFQEIFTGCDLCFWYPSERWYLWWGDRKGGHLACKSACANCPEVFLPQLVEEESTQSASLPRFTWKTTVTEVVAVEYVLLCVSTI